ncbi:hypothetical protein [Tumebacillus permanentifrigoris]|uniref:Uncharacterized protein n=1 Tax=Tumebacillus permanentifrigoris TaxID=378543 RepID=A0A316DAH1_9BACL|nr:hypothetical protein [Tumebacillus permanentifrigoris]PWK09662.1 hypothetical protein C7459_11398 [Tumebacillus permanentifrigoris]
MLLSEYLHTLPLYHIADLYDTLYQPSVPHAYTEDEYRQAVVSYWNNPQNWDALVGALSVTERQTLTRLALQERCEIDAFLEELNSIGLVVLHREVNRFVVPDDVRVWLLERLPSLQDRLQAQEQADPDGTTPV